MKETSVKIPLVDLKAQYQNHKSEIDAAMQRVIDTTSFIMGPAVREFEEAFAACCTTSYAIGVDSGTGALNLVFRALGLGPGDEVITTPHTFIATTEMLNHMGVKPVFVDIDPKTYNINPALIEGAITPRTKVILPVHLYGQPADMDPILTIAERHGLNVIEDAAQAHAAEYKGRRTGSLAKAAIFSFYPGKNLGAYGDAGAVVTDDEALGEKVCLLRNHGRFSKYEHQIAGWGARMDTLQAAILHAKLAHLEDWTQKRRAVAARYRELLSGLEGVELPFESPDVRHVYHLFVTRVSNRDQVWDKLKARGVGAGVHYPVPLHLQPTYAYLGHRRGDFPETESAAGSVLSLPLYPEMSEEQVEYVVDAMRESIQ
jgi:dTDP-4-amino-4,6-dideoxygalactose transaminase